MYLQLREGYFTIESNVQKIDHEYPSQSVPICRKGMNYIYQSACMHLIEIVYFRGMILVFDENRRVQRTTLLTE